MRTWEQFRAALDWRPAAPRAPLDVIYCEFADPGREAEAVALARPLGVRVGLAGPRILRPGGEAALEALARVLPDAVLVRNLGTLGFFRDRAPGLSLVGDATLNAANELSTALLVEEGGLARVTPARAQRRP